MESRVIIFSIEQMFESSGKYPSTWKNDMNSAQLHNDQNNDDEIDLAQIIRDIAKEKKRFLRNGAKVLGLWLVLFIVYGLFTFNPSTYYSLVVGLTFPQASQGKYPNGATFSASDIVANGILDKVYNDNHLVDRGIKLETFQHSFAAIPDTGEVNFIDTKYKNLLAQKNLSRTDVEKIEAEYKAEVEQTSSKNIKILFDTRGESYDTATASRILTDIVTQWNKTAIEKLGVSRSPVLDGLVLNEGMKSEPPYVVLNYLNDLIFRAQAVIRAMRADPNSNAYRDPQTNLNLSGVSAKLQEISTFQVDRLDAFVAISTKPSEWEVLETQYKLKELRAYKALLADKAETYRKALADYTNNTNGNKSSYASGEARGRVNNDGGTGVQIDGDAITKLLSLAAQGKDAEYRQKLTSDRIAMENESSDLDIQIQKLERRLSMASKNNQFTESSKKQYEALLGTIFGEIANVIGVVTRIQMAAQKDFLGDSGSLFIVVNQPHASSPGRAALLKAGLISFVLFGLLSIFVTLIQMFGAKVLGKEQAAQWKWR